MSNWYPFNVTGPLTVDGALTILGANADRLILGGSSAEGGDIKVYTDGSGNLAMSLDADTGQLKLPVVGSSSGILFGGDVLVYRHTANLLYLGIGDNLHLPTTSKLTFRDTLLVISSKDDGHLDLDADISVDINSGLVGAIDAITADTGGTAASLATVITEITTDGDQNLDDVTLANGLAGQIKIFVVVAEGDAADTVKITPATMSGGTEITFSATPVGEGCSMVYNSTSGWVVTANNGGTIT